MPLNVVIPLLLQVVGLLIACAVAIVAWGPIGFFGWLAVALYLAGDAFAPDADVTEEERTQLNRGH